MVALFVVVTIILFLLADFALLRYRKLVAKLSSGKELVFRINNQPIMAGGGQKLSKKRGSK